MAEVLVLTVPSESFHSFELVPKALLSWDLRFAINLSLGVLEITPKAPKRGMVIFEGKGKPVGTVKFGGIRSKIPPIFSPRFAPICH